MKRIVVKTHIVGLYLFFLSVLCSVSLQAGDIKVLPADPAIRVETMPNGLKCYVAVNPEQKGRADFALIQNTGAGTIPGVDGRKLEEISRGALSGQQRLLSPSVQQFFSSHGAVPGKAGFVSITGDATLYHFRNVDLSLEKTTLDSSLFVLMGMVERVISEDDPVIREWYVPSDQAIIVAGDVDAGKVLDKLRTFSYMSPRFDSVPRREYEWKTIPGMDVSVIPTSGIGTIELTWRLPRTPEKMMNTVQPLVMDKYLTELSVLAERRIKGRLKEQDIPYASVKCSYETPLSRLCDEEFSVEVRLAPENIGAATVAVSSCLSSIVAGNVSTRELGDVERVCFEVRRQRERELTNTGYVKKCAAAFLYNASVASETDENAFIMTRSIPDSTELKLFTSIAKSSLLPSENLSLLCLAPDGYMTGDSLRCLFTEAWKEDVACRDRADEPVRAPFLVSPDHKVKIRTTSKEYLTKGTITTLSNGIRVVVKPTDAKDVIYWSLVLNGGYGNISDIEVGEAEYVAEYLDMCRIGGLDAASFMDAVRRKGITMDVEVGHSRTVLSGRVADDGLSALMRVLLTVMETAVPDSSQIEYRMKCEPLVLAADAGSFKDRVSVIDSVMCPGYRYSKRKSGFDWDFIRKAERFYKELASKVDDGIFLLVGDVDEKHMKEALRAYAGAFSTSGRRASRPVTGYQPISGTVSLYEKGLKNSVDIVMSVPLAATAENWYMAEMTSMCLERNVSQIVTGKGLYLRLKYHYGFFPQERVSVMMSLLEAPVGGFASGTSHQDPDAALASVRGLLKNMDSIDLTESELKSYKSLLKERIRRRMKYPEYWQAVVAMRYIDGRDFISGYEAKIDAITVDDIKNQLRLLSEGARVEYVITKE